MGTGDPRAAASLELQDWHDQAAELCDPNGEILGLIRDAQVALENSYSGRPMSAIERVTFKVCEGFWAVLGAHETVVYSYQRINRTDDPELARWHRFREMAGICLHNTARLREEVSRYLARDGIPPSEQ